MYAFCPGSIQAAGHVLRGLQGALPTAQWHPPLGWLCHGGHCSPENGYKGQYDVARAKQYTHERTKERLAKMHALPTPSPTESPQP